MPHEHWKKHCTSVSAARSASGVLGCTTLPIVVGPDPRALSSVTSVAASHSRDCLSPPPDRERLCSRGPLMVMSSLCCRESRVLPRSPRPGGYAMATGGGDAGEHDAVGTIRESLGTRGGNQMEGHMSGIRKWLHNGSSISSAPP